VETFMFKYVDAFSGCGGLSLGLSKAGLEASFSFDLDSFCIDTMKKNQKYFQHAVAQLDINELTNFKWRKNFKNEFENVSVMAGGPPCQGFSIQRIGADIDDRNDLVLSYIKLVCEVLPEFFIMENVSGLKGKRGKETLDNAIKLAEKCGYYIHQKVIDAQTYGVPQRRKRLILVGELSKGRSPVFEFPKEVIKTPTVRDVIGHLPDVSVDGSENPKLSHHRADKLSEMNKKRLAYLAPGQGMQDLPVRLRANCHKAGADKIGHRNVYGRMSWDDVAPTITARFDSFTRGQFGHPEKLRSISLREGALLQTFPMDFVFTGSKVDIARQIGNAVPPTLAFHLGKAVLKALKLRHSTGLHIGSRCSDSLNVI
jgi:DNA (cytosine-5)-methyltransferase 1